MTYANDKPAPHRLGYRIARAEDYELLVQLRTECGWGLDKLEKGWKDPNRVFCVLEVLDEGVDVGMACWVLQDEDLTMADRSTRTVHLASLFIRHKWQGLGLGKAALDLLERVAVEEYNAQWITLDTAAYFIEILGDGTATEDLSRPGKTVGWYTKNGYVQFKENRPMFPGATPDNPNHLFSATFLRKRGELVSTRLPRDGE